MTNNCVNRLDQIDTVLAEHYGFTEEELDFIINFDIKSGALFAGHTVPPVGHDPAGGIPPQGLRYG